MNLAREGVLTLSWCLAWFLLGTHVDAPVHSTLPTLTSTGDLGNILLPDGQERLFILFLKIAFIGFCLITKVIYVHYGNLRKQLAKGRI